jgi:hypothetical protein
MAYDEELAARVRKALDNTEGLVEKKMFGGVGYMLHGNMACGVLGNKVIIRVGPDRHAMTIEQPETVPFDITGRPMKGWVMVLPEGYETDEMLMSWLQEGISFAKSLPPK